MKSTWKRNTIGAAALIFLIGLVGTIATGFQYFTYDFTSSDKQVAVEKAEVVDLDINFAKGIFHLSEGANQLMEGKFQYTENFDPPKIKYRENGSKGSLSLSQGKPTNWFTWFAEENNEWKIRLQNDLPIHLNIETGVGINQFQLGDLNLQSLNLEAGVGDTELDLREDWQNSFDANIKVGVGEFRILLPEETGVRVKVDHGVGNVSAVGLEKLGGYYQNSAYETATEKIDITIELGVGELELIVGK